MTDKDKFSLSRTYVLDLDAVEETKTIGELQTLAESRVTSAGPAVPTTWRDRFDERSIKNAHQVARWQAGADNHAELRESLLAISEFLKLYEAAGQPGRDSEMPRT